MLRLSRCLTAATVLLVTLASTPAATFRLEAERLELPGGWDQILNPRNDDARGYIVATAHAKNAPAAGAIQLPHAGKWRVWVRTKDFPNDRPGTRTFSIRLGEEKSKVLIGKHAQAIHDGWAWEDAGVFEVGEGPTLVVVGDDAAHSARCDAIVFTDNMSYTPEGVPWNLQKQAAEVVPLTIDEKSTRGYIPAPVLKAEEAALATLQNEGLRLTFHQASTESGPAVAMQVATRDGEKWLPLSSDPGADSYRVLYRPADSDPKIVTYRVHPIWNTQFSPRLEASAGKSRVSTLLGISSAPWASGQCFPLRPKSVRQVDPQTVELAFPETPTGQLTATWRMNGKQPSAKLELHFAPKQPGHVSLGYHGPLATPPEETDFLLLPFMFQGQRFPDKTVTLLSSQTPTPVALVNKDGVSCAVVAEPGELPFDWPSAQNSRYALALRNEFAQAQPLIYTPVLGQPGSVTDGGAVTGRLHLWVQRGDWYAAYRRIADELYGLKDYRKPVKGSLSDAALNILDLMRDEKAAGWDARTKAPWNIERPNLVSHSAPLTYLSYYLLTGDQDFYRRFALPTLEYMVSRPGAHFGAEDEMGDGSYYAHQPMRGPGKLYGATTFSAAYAMTHGRSPIFGEYSLENGEARRTRPHGHSQPFDDALALYRLTGEKQWLEKATAGADEYIQKNLETLPTRDLGPMPFINNSFVPNWEGLLHLYEATGQKRFLDGATEGARWLLTSLWTQPLIPEGKTTINPGGIYDHARYIWWWGDKRFRLGIYDGPGNWDPIHTEAPKLPERDVPAWTVSQVGMGLEQPSTYTRGRNHANISMSNWSANLLRLAESTGDVAFRTSARNATIGRFTNYPGYYHDGFTDEYQRPDYPFTGPDITSLYMHHVPVMAAWILDYLFTDAEMRSAGAVTFPWVRQNGYVWFDNRLRGHAPGKVYGRTAWPWLHRTAAKVDNIAVDRVLAHGDGAFHVVLMNQTREPQTVQVSFDEKTLGRSVDGAEVQVRQNNKPAAPLAVKNKSVSVALSPLGIATLTMEGVKIDVPTHRSVPAKHLALPKEPASTNKPVSGTKLEAIGTVLQAPPFETRDFYVYLTATLGECRAATLRYRVGDTPEKQIEDKEFPFEFSAPLTDLASPITWEMDVQLADGKWVKTSGAK